MSTAPQFAASVNVGSALVPATFDTSLTAPANVATVVTAGASGTKIEELVLQGVANTASGIINIFRYDGTTYHLIDQFLVAALTSSTTSLAWRQSRTYLNLFLKSTDSLRVTCTVSGLQSAIKVTAFGGDF